MSVCHADRLPTRINEQRVDPCVVGLVALPLIVFHEDDVQALLLVAMQSSQVVAQLGLLAPLGLLLMSTVLVQVLRERDPVV